MATGHVCFEVPEKDAAFPIRLLQTGFNEFTVEYGKQIKTGLGYSETARELGAAIMHSAACNGTLDNRSRMEAREAGDSKPYFTEAD